MSSLVLELQRDAMNSTVPVTDLLRKAYVVAVKLNLPKFREWIEYEQNGYTETKLAPDYRIVHGIPRVRNPYHGYQPFHIQDPGIANTASKACFNNPLSEIEALANDPRDETHIPTMYPNEMRKFLMRGMSIPLEPSLHIGKTQFGNIVHAVRNAILTWSLELEKDGILGNDLSFSHEEKQVASAKADELAQVVNITVIGNMHNSSIQQASPSAKA